ncbi:MAG: ion channel [Desulfurococcales archaeon]|nr:ion channel [Desulfurococcales archaeon]
MRTASSPTFKKLIDATLTASSVLVGVSFLLSPLAQGRILAMDLAVSLILLAMGIVVRVRPWILVASSVPLYTLDLVGLSMGGGHFVGALLVGFRVLRIVSDLKYLETHASIIGREIISISVQAALMAGVMLAGGSIALYVAESGSPNSPIKTLGDALWASIATTTTVGYGDVVPVTPLGRLVAAMLMIFGVAYITFLMTNIATLLVRIVQIQAHAAGDDLEAEKLRLLETLRMRLEEMDDEEFNEILHRLNMIRIFKMADENDIFLLKPVDGGGEVTA